MTSGKWIGGFLGFITTGSILGALAGFTLGALFDNALNDTNHAERYNNQEYDNLYGNAYGNPNTRIYEGQRNSFRFSLLVLAAYIIRADGKVMHSEMEFLRQFLRRNFGPAASTQGEQVILKIFEQQKQMGATQFRQTIHSACRQIAVGMSYEMRLQLVSFLTMIAQADGRVSTEEIDALREVARYLGISDTDINSILNLDQGRNNLEAAYKVLGIGPDVSDQEVKAAYRKMALQHHPDRVATLGEDVKKAVEKKFQEINAAKDLIFKARGMT